MLALVSFSNAVLVGTFFATGAFALTASELLSALTLALGSAFFFVGVVLDAGAFFATGAFALVAVPDTGASLEL